MIVAKPPSASPLSPRNAIAAVPLVLLALLIVCNTLLLREFAHGPESILFTLALWPLAISCGAIYAAIKKGSPLVRVFVVLLGLGAPFVAMYLRDALDAVDSWKAQRHSAELARRAPHELAFLQKYMSEPRTVIHASFPFVVVEGGYGLVLYDVQGPEGSRSFFDLFLQNVIVGRRVTATFPPDFLARYQSGARSWVTLPYAQGPSRDFGDAPAVLAHDGIIVNFDLRRRYGYLSSADSMLMMDERARTGGYPVPAESAWTISSGRGHWKWVPGRDRPIWEPQ